MKNKSLVGLITFFCTLFIMILVMNICDSKTKKIFSFDRKFNTKKQLLTFQKEYNKSNESEHVMYINSDTFIVERDINSIDEQNNKYDFYFEDFNFKNKQKLSAVLPKGSNVMFCDTSKVLFTKTFNFFKYDFKTKNTINITFKNLKITCLEPINHNLNKFICLAQFYDKGTYKTGFYILDLNLKTIQLSIVLETNKEDKFLSNSLQYVGKFNFFDNESIMTYYCEKYSKIFFFDNTGKFIKELQTNDKVPLPEIAKNQQGNSFYSRSGTWYSSLGMFIKDKQIYVFSGAAKDKEYITIDEYTYNDLKYKQSYRIDYKKLNANNIMNSYINVVSLRSSY